MQGVKDSKSDITLNEEWSRIPDHGPLDIDDLQEFLKQSKIEFDNNWTKPFVHPEISLNHFKQLEVFAKGSFGVVILVKHRQSNQHFAMKGLEKGKLIKFKALDRARHEKNILKCLNFPFTTYLKYFFLDNSYIYFVMPYVQGGELFQHLKKVRRMNEVDAKFYASQVVLVLEYLHYMDIIYRDLKLENILIDQTGFVKVIDFGLSKRVTSLRTFTVCGTVDYLAPEVLLNKGYGKAVDWWAVGVFIFELTSGSVPFHAPNRRQLFERILQVKYKTPRYFSDELKSLVKGVLQRDLSWRLGNLKNGVDDIKGHAWFREINWLAVLNRRVDPPFIPQDEEAGSTHNFNKPTNESLHTLKMAEWIEYPTEFADF